MSDNVCGDCEYYKDDVDGVGLCKCNHVETHFTSNAPNRVIRRDNGWPVAKAVNSVCGKFEPNSV